MTFEQLLKEFRKKYDTETKYTTERIALLEKQLQFAREIKVDAIRRAQRAESKLRTRDAKIDEARERATMYKTKMNSYRKDLIEARRLLRNTKHGD